MYLTAQKIHSGQEWMPAGTTLEIAEDGTLISILDQPPSDVQYCDGILCPGFVNVHCHLELSHMKGVIPEHTGLIPFLKTIPLHRNDFTDEHKRNARQDAYNELQKNGVVALGDIANTTDTLSLRSMGRLHIHTFIESIGVNALYAQRAFETAMTTYGEFSAQTHVLDSCYLRQSIVPHAPYSVSSALFKLINAHDAVSLLSIHNQESPEEDKYYKTKSGGVTDLLTALGADDSGFNASGVSSLQTYLEYLSPGHPLILVHNTYSAVEDIAFAMQRFKDVFCCLCPNANLYIEARLPDINMLMSSGATICIGTDSLASNHELSVLSELYTIRQHYSLLEWETLLRWGTYNGAQALHMQEKLGQIIPGVSPGILQITGLDNNSVKPTVKRVV